MLVYILNDYKSKQISKSQEIMSLNSHICLGHYLFDNVKEQISTLSCFLIHEDAENLAAVALLVPKNPSEHQGAAIKQKILQVEKIAVTSTCTDLFYASLSNQYNGVLFGTIKETCLSSLVKKKQNTRSSE